MTETSYHLSAKRFSKRYPSSYVYADKLEDKHIRYKARQIRRFFKDLQKFLDRNKRFFATFSRLMTHKIKIVNPENSCIIQKDGYEYVGDTINVYTTHGVFQIRFDIDEQLK